MLVAGETSGDLLAAELVRALREAPALQALPFAPRFFGAGGPRMAEAGVTLDFDLTRHAVVGLAGALANYRKFKRFFDRLVHLARARRPEVIVFVDFSGFNRRLAHAIRRRVRAQAPAFNNWRPRLVQYVSPQVWASRPGRARALARDLDLLLCLFPFEQEWYRQETPHLRVEFVGHPLCDRFASAPARSDGGAAGRPLALLLPGSREGELLAHLPVMLRAAALLEARRQDLPGPRTTPAAPLRWRVVLPNARLAAQARRFPPLSSPTGPVASGNRAGPEFEVRVGGLAESLAEAELAIASTGTVTLECAFFRVPVVALYRTSWINYLIARQIATVKYLAMPNLLAGAEVYPEYLQSAATPANLAAAALAILTDPARRRQVQSRLAAVIQGLGGPGASTRAAQALLSTLDL